MASFPRLILQFAATIGFAAMLTAGAAPVVAAESAVAVSEAAKTSPSTIRHHASRVRLATNYHRHVYAIRRDLGCSGVWCGRQFVLMVGIGY
jgi:hypothetical protein